MSDEDRMVTSNEEADEEEDDDEEHGFDMANFMFGNVDSDGQLEADFLDEEAKRSLASLQEAQAGLDVSSLAESGPTNSAAANSYKASTPAAAKVLQSAVEKIGQPVQNLLKKPTTLQQQIEMAQAAGVDLPFVTGSDGRPLLQYSRLLPKGNPVPPSQEEEKDEGSRKLSETSAKLRAERLNILKAQAAAMAATTAAAASATASAAAAHTDEGDEEEFMHAAAVGKLPDHLVRSESQESDSDVITDRPDEDERQPAESEARLQQDPKRLQAFVRPKKHKGIKPIPWGLPLCQDPGPTGLAAIPDADLDLIHVIQWERDIIWDDSDDPSESSVRLRDDAQNGAATGIEEDEWDDLDRALDMGSDSPRAKHSRHQLPMSTLEPLPQKPAKGSHASVTTSIHPQMLRLNELAVSNQQQSAEAPGPAAAAGHLEIPTQKAKLAPFNPNLKADAWLLKMDLKGAEGGPPMQPPPALLLDLNDPNMTFEVLRGTEVEAFASAAATILPAMPEVQPDMVNLIVHSTAGAVMARFNISKDSVYFPAGKRKGDKPGAVSRLHTTQASNMTTIPLIFPTRSEMFHRPLGLWNPLVSKKLHVKNQNKLQIDEMLVKISSLVGGNPNWHTGEPLTISFKKVSAAETVRALWGKAKQDKFKGSDSTGNPTEEQPPHLVDRRNPVQPLDLDASLHNSVLKEPVLEFAAIFSSIKLLPTTMANAVPSQTSGAALAPPAAFQKRKDLSATEGHVLLLEYFEEFPLMLSHPGMGAKLTTYYRRESATDNNHQRLLKEHDKWRVGNVEPLQAQEESPFIGQLDPGKHQLAIETGMYRAPGFAYTTPPTDFLLIRNATGAISLRELTGCFAVGQQVPAMRAPVPGSRDVREIEGGRLVVQVVRDLRSKQSRAEKAEAKTGKYVAPKVSFKELKQVFRHLSDQTIRIRLRDKCECIAVKENDLDGWWQLRPGARLPSEAELRRMLSPDQWCLYDTTKAGIHRLREQGISKYDALVQIPAERMQIAIEQLPEEKQAAGKYLDLAIKTTPWALTDNYVSRERENRGSQVAFAGPGDPTGKGRGFSFVKDTRRGMGHQAVKQKEGKLTGTNADLRRMKVPQLKEELRKVGVPEDMIKNGRRWELVDLLRTVATVGEGDSNFARNQRMTAAEMMARKTRLCQEIWQRQVAVLANIPEQQASGETASEDDMGEELQACLAGNEEAESAPAKPAEEDQQRLNEAQQAAEDEAALQAMREEGMLSDQPASSHPQPVVPKKKLEAEPGARRMRRKITWTRPDGTVAIKEIIYTQEHDQDKVTALNAIYGVEAWNFGSRTLKGRKGNRNLEKAASQMKAEPDALPLLPPDMATADDAAAAADATAGDDYDAAVELQQAVASPVRRVPSKKTGGVRKGGAGSKAMGKKAAVVQICRDCGQAGHLTKKNKKCLMYVEPEPEVLEPWIPDVMLGHPLAQGFGFDGQAEPVAPPQQTTPTGLKIKLGPSPKTSPVVLPAAASTEHAPQHQSEGPGPIKLKLSGSLKRRESAADSETSGAPVKKKPKLKVTLKSPTQLSSLPQADSCPVDAAPSDPSRAAAEHVKASDLFRAAGERPRASTDASRAATDRPRISLSTKAAAHGPEQEVGPSTADGATRAPPQSAPGPHQADPAVQASAPPKRVAPPKKAVPKKKKDSGRKVLAKILTHILADCKKADGLTKIWWEVFNSSVTKTGSKGVADYNDFVKPEDEMWIKKINQKLTRSAYVTHRQFREDVHQILKNAQKYNLSTGVCAHPDAAGMADKIYQTSLAGLDRFSAEILNAEQQIQQEEAHNDL
ncbi:hypothetical protein WJX79_008358 [Trebouxia sp. C0005]